MHCIILFFWHYVSNNCNPNAAAVLESKNDFVKAWKNIFFLKEKIVLRHSPHKLKHWVRPYVW